MPDLTPLLTWLSALGPWGVAAGIGVTLLIQLLRSRLSTQPAPITPTPPASPATNPLRLDAQFPILNRLLTVLGIVPANRPATSADISHDLLLQLRAEVEGVAEAKAEAHAAALADLVPEPIERKP